MGGDVGLHTPLGVPILVASRGMAVEIARVWKDKDVYAQIARRLTVDAMEHVRGKRDAIGAELVGRMDYDLLRCWAEWPKDLVSLQKRLWQPWLDWLERWANIRLPVTRGVRPTSVRDGGKLVKILAEYDDMTLSVLRDMSATSGSLTLSLAFVCGQMNSEKFVEAALLGERYQIGCWGSDAQGDARLHAMEEEWRAIARFFTLCQGDSKPASDGKAA